MKTKITLMFIFLMQINGLLSQTNLCLNTANPGSINSPNFWARGGNSGGGNIFGTLQNFDIDIKTDNILRMIINGTKAPTINGVVVNTSGYVGIGNSPAGLWNCTAGQTGPWALLHLQGPNNTTFPAGGAGWRSWMKTGTFTVENTDATYFGLKNEVTTGGANRSDAVINWSDDPAAPGGGPDNLRFIFTQFATGNGNCTNCPLNPQGFEGMEIARMTAENDYGRMGIGPLFTSALLPARRLEVVDGQTGNPQLRLTQTQNVNTALGLFTDFYTTGPGFLGQGNLFIDPRNNGALGYVGINLGSPPPLAINPNLSLWINGQAAITTVNNDNTITKVLVWDDVTGGVGLGRVKWRAINTFPGGGFGQACGAAGNPGQLTQNTEVPTNTFNFVFTNNQAQPSTQNNVGIGLANGNCLPQARLDVLQTSNSAGTIGINSLNTDLPAGGGQPSIALKAKVTKPRNIAAWFEAVSPVSTNYRAVFVPKDGGNVSIGYPLNGPSSPVTTLLWVNGDASFLGNPYPSDAILKQDTVLFNNGLDVVRNMRIMSYRYNGLAGLPTNRTYFGLIAEQLLTVS